MVDLDCPDAQCAHRPNFYGEVAHTPRQVYEVFHPLHGIKHTRAWDDLPDDVRAIYEYDWSEVQQGRTGGVGSRPISA